MSARHKLNQAVIQGCLIVAALVGLLFQSWLVFLLTAAVLVGLSISSGEIRWHSSRKRGRHDRR